MTELDIIKNRNHSKYPNEPEFCLLLTTNQYIHTIPRTKSELKKLIKKLQKQLKHPTTEKKVLESRIK